MMDSLVYTQYHRVVIFATMCYTRNKKGSDKRVLSVKEMAIRTGLSKGAIIKYIHQGYIRYTEENGSFRIDQQEYERFVADWHIGRKMYNQVELANILGISRPQTLGKHIKSGRISTVELPNGVRMVPHEEMKRLKANASKAQKMFFVSDIL